MCASSYGMTGTVVYASPTPHFWVLMSCLFFFLVFLPYFYISLTFLCLWCLTSSISVGSSWHFSFSPSLFLPAQRKCCALPRANVCERGTRAILETEFVCSCTRSNALGVCVCFFFVSSSSKSGSINSTRNYAFLSLGHFMVLKFSPFKEREKDLKTSCVKLEFGPKNIQIKHSIFFIHINALNSISKFQNIQYSYI